MSRNLCQFGAQSKSVLLKCHFSDIPQILGVLLRVHTRLLSTSLKETDIFFPQKK